MTTVKKFNKTVIATTLFTLFYQQFTFAEVADNSEINALEVIEVTSQKRVQSLQDVPASITTIDGNRLADTGITQMEEMSDYVPNFSVSKSGQGYNIYMRGIGSGPNQGFEQTVGTYVDGIYRGRAVLMRSSFLDVDMVEVLRGPQGTLFGMNTTAGALNITSKNATQEFEASVKGYYVPEFNKQDLEFAVSGGLTDELSARIAMKYETDDGYVENVVTGNDEPSRDNIAARLTLDWNISDKLNANLKIQHDSDEIKGRNVIVTVEPYLEEAGTPATEALLASLMEYDFDYKTANTTPALGEKQFEESTANHLTLNLSYELGDLTLNSVTGWQDYDLDGAKDQDSTARTLIYSEGSPQLLTGFIG
ncbi:TonB-dependent receptor [Pseudoalteromonas tetraodonis]|uniref:TonB-dependent receptor n=1 Tax=Pseudoalteromonas tetraodonis TaxID=43659 RepID=UPI003A96E092